MYSKRRVCGSGFSILSFNIIIYLFFKPPSYFVKMLSIFNTIPTHMDYKGQKLAEQIFQGIILVSAVIGFVYGLIIQQFGWTVYIVLGGFAISCLLTLPPWPMYRRSPLAWQPMLPESQGETREKPQENVKKPRKHK